MIKEFKQIFRKKALIIPLFAFPLIMIIFFGYGMGGTVKNVDILVVNDDTGTASSSLVQEIGSFIPKYGDVKMFSITYTKDMGQSEAERKIDAGQYKAVLIIPPAISTLGPVGNLQFSALRLQEENRLFPATSS